MLRVKNLKKSYRDVVALNNVSFQVAEGEIFGLLGPNGAGKTTAISILSSLIEADSGEIYYQDTDVFSNIIWWRKQIGIVPQEMAFYEELSALDNLMLWASLYGLTGNQARNRCEELIGMMGLSLKKKAKVSEFSGGMKRRLNIALGIIHKPRLLFLDEPTVGIDVQARVKIKEILKELSAEGMSMIYTTHQMDEAEELCNRIAIIDEGKIIAQGTLMDLVSQLKERDSVELAGNFSKDSVNTLVESTKGVALTQFNEQKIILEVEKEDSIPLIIQNLMGKKTVINSVDIRRPNLETLFIKLTGKELRDQ